MVGKVGQEISLDDLSEALLRGQRRMKDVSICTNDRRIVVG